MGQEIQSRSVRLPIAFHDSKSREYIDKYMASVRSEAPYLPDNMEFIARCNGLSSIEEVQKYFLSSEQMVLGLGDVFLGAPCAVALDPSVRLSAPKYNPARTMTPEGAVGIGGAFMCIYPMESPGGYQLIGRTIPIWDAWQLNAAFKEAPWLLRNFDRIQFYEVTEEELDEMGKGVRDNRFSFEIEEGVFSLQEYEKFVETVRPQMELLRKNQEKFIIEATKGY